MAEYRAIKTGLSRFSWSVQEKRWLVGWHTIDSANTKDEAQQKIDFLACGPEIIYPTKGLIPRPGDPLGIRSEQE